MVQSNTGSFAVERVLWDAEKELAEVGGEWLGLTLVTSIISRIWHPRTVIPLRHNGKSIPAEQWDGLNNTPIINTCDIRTFLASSLKFCPPAFQPLQFKFWSQSEWGLFFSLLSGMAYGWDEERKTPYWTSQPTKPCPLCERHHWRRDMHLFKLPSSYV